MAEQFELPFLGEVPLIQSIREGGDMGVPAVLDAGNPAGKVFAELAGNVARNISLRNANLEPTKVVQVEI